MRRVADVDAQVLQQIRDRLSDRTNAAAAAATTNHGSIMNSLDLYFERDVQSDDENSASDDDHFLAQMSYLDVIRAYQPPAVLNTADDA